MEYRQLPHGSENEKISVIGIGTAGMESASDAEIERMVCTGLDGGINYFDLAASGGNIFRPFGRAFAGQREKAQIQLHFGAVYRGGGSYGWSRNLKTIRQTFDWEMKMLGTDYVDFGFLHCIDETSDFEQMCRNGIFDFVKELKRQGVVHHIGFSSHTPSVANRILDTGTVDMMMFSINPAYDYEQGDAYGIGTTSERARLFARCEAEGVGISVMKAFHGGQLLDARTSPFRQALTRYQCIQYALDRPGVLTVLPGVRSTADVKELLGFCEADDAQKDYSVLGAFTPAQAHGHCVYCNHCQPCPAGIDVGLVNKYYDLALAGDPLAAGHYDKLTTRADACTACGHCDRRCPFGVKQSERMAEIDRYFSHK